MSKRIGIASSGELVEEELEQYPDNDMVNSPYHYTSYVKGLNIEAIDCMRAAFGDEDVKAFCTCNALKYIYRHKSKGGNLDIQKAIWYLNKYLELNKEGGEEC